MLNCTVCNKRLPVYFRGDICSAKCRQKKSRDKRMAQSRAYAMGFQINQWAKMLSEGTIDHEEASELLYAVWEQLNDFHKQIQNARAVAEAKAEQKAAK